MADGFESKNMQNIENINFFRNKYCSNRNKELVELCRQGDAQKISSWYERDSGSKKYFDEYLKNRMSQRLICKYIKSNFKVCKILDVACGHGEMGLYLQANGYGVSGLDLNKYRVDSLLGKLEDIRCESIENTTYGDNSFDILIATEVLEHVANLETTLSKMRRLLKRGGSVFITVPYEYKIDYDSHVRIFTEDILAAAMQKAGFIIQCICKLPYLNHERDNDLLGIFYKQ